MKRWACLLMMAVGFSGTAKSLEIKQSKIEFVKTPQYSVRVAGMTIDNDRKDYWFRLMVEYITAPELLSELTIDFYVAIPKPRELKGVSDGKPRLFHRRVEYKDIWEGKHMAAVYMHPNVFKKYSAKNDPSYPYAVIISDANGEPVGGFTNYKGGLESKWWEDSSLVRESGALLNRNQTPFEFVDIEAYEMIVVD